MLAYAFNVLNEECYQKLGTEEFNNALDMYAAVLGVGISNQIRKGLGKRYIEESDTLKTIRGKLDISTSIKQNSFLKKEAVCTYDEFSSNHILNQVLKSTAFLLIKSPQVSPKNTKLLKKTMLFFNDVDVIDINHLDWTRIQVNRNDQTYRLLLNICYLAISGHIQNKHSGTTQLIRFMEDFQLEALYERFVLRYYQKHFPDLHPKSERINWNVDDDIIDLLPIMKTDISLFGAEKVVIIDTKFYQDSLQTNQYGKQTQHSSNLYQIYSYVKNKDKTHSGKVKGILLYAKTDESISPEHIYHLDSNEIEVACLDLNDSFKSISEKLTSIAKLNFR